MHLNFFQYGVVAIAAVAIIAGRSAGRDLRPSEHGLVHQLAASSPAQNGDVRSFFGSPAVNVTVPVPEARGIGNETWWSGNDDGRSRDSHDFWRDHVRVGFLVVAAACGFSGVVLLVIAGNVLIGRHRRKKAEAGRLSANSERREVNDK